MDGNVGANVGADSFGLVGVAKPRGGLMDRQTQGVDQIRGRPVFYAPLGARARVCVIIVTGAEKSMFLLSLSGIG